MSEKSYKVSEKKKVQEINNGATAESTLALMPPAFNQPVQMTPEHDHDHDHDHEHEHDHEVQGAPTADGENGRNGSYTPQPKDDKIDQQIPDTEAGLFEMLKKAIFLSQNYGPTNMQSSTGTGAYSAAYNPRTRQLNISAICQANFLNGLMMDPGGSGMVVVNPTGSTGGDAKLQQQANTANTSLSVPEKIAFVATYTWSAQEITDGMANLQTQLRVTENLWSGNHSFFVDKDGWRDVRAQVGVNITATQGTAVSGTDHLQISSVKTPAGGPDVGAFVRTKGDSNTANLMYLDDDNLTGVNDHNFLHQIVDFPGGGSTLTNDHKALLDMLIIRHRDDNTRLKADGNPANDAVSNGVLNKFRLVGHASSDGEETSNQKLAADRIKAVQDYLIAGGLDLAGARIETDNQGETGATEDHEWRRVDIYIGSGEAQHTLSHEFGHVFGLKDEYAMDPGGGLGGTGQTSGTQVGHDGLSTSIGAGNATSENNDGIMSMGNTVRGQHYSTFGEALKTLTNIQEWKLIT